MKWLVSLFRKADRGSAQIDVSPLMEAKTSARRKAERSPLSGRIRVPLKGNGSFAFDVVGEASYQTELSAIAGPKTSQGKSLEIDAVIGLEPDNPVDPNAVCVRISGMRVGYFSKADAKDYAEQKTSSNDKADETVRAVIVGGFKSSRKEGHYGVRLDITRHR